MTALSGNVAKMAQAFADGDATADNSLSEEQKQRLVEQSELLSFLQRIDRAEPDEIVTFADQFSDAERHLKNTQRSKADAESDADTSEKGTLSAEAILATSVTSPTGTQIVSTLNIDARTIESFKSLRNVQLSSAHRRLAEFIPQLQEAFGRKQLTPTAAEVAGYFGLIDPLLLSAYIPYAYELLDLSEEQVAECFHEFQLVDGYPTIHGVPVWERQEWERIEYYNLYKLYRDMRYAFYNEADALLTNRSIAVLSKATRVPAPLLQYLATVYCWSLRTTMYDSWMYSMQQRRIAVKRELMLDRHSKISQGLIQKAFTCLSKQTDKLSAKDALEMLKLGLAYERISAGLLGDKPDTVAQSAQQTPLVSIVNQTNNTTGPLQVNNESHSQRQLQENMKSNDTLLGILSVLQRSGAFDVLVQKAAAEEALEAEVPEAVVVEEG